MIQYRYINITLTSLQASYVYLVDIYAFLAAVMEHDYGWNYEQ